MNAGSNNHPPRALRSSGYEPWEVATTHNDLSDTVTRLAAHMADRWTGGSIGIIAPQRRLALLRDRLPDATVVSATEAKGLEWDAALVVDPTGITQEPRGWNGLYVALTRCTQELGQIHLTNA
ncbi:ATP-binding domain-containing protein [Branchiibius hedensis]|uniref:ATP-binding domain-containing protein n=1 Tax=Branchiibius hedensis TaxID=672460 RepID=UPI000D6BA60A|nr:ATP-binding domain-containing protein [Branchiibius hedensis]